MRFSNSTGKGHKNRTLDRSLMYVTRANSHQKAYEMSGQVIRSPISRVKR